MRSIGLQFSININKMLSRLEILTGVAMETHAVALFKDVIGHRQLKSEQSKASKFQVVGFIGLNYY